MVAMGRALMMDPSVLLLDEPSAGLSPAKQDEVFLRTREINKTGVSVVMVEQNARRCLQICDRGYVLDQGRNAYTGAGRALAKDPQGHRALPGHARQGGLSRPLLARSPTAGRASVQPRPVPPGPRVSRSRTVRGTRRWLRRPRGP
jgi:energy-coupling factor transporter ATP-binding protein EcfA2